MTEEINQDNEEETCEVDVTEVSLDEEEINELIKKLQELKQTKKEIIFDLDAVNELLIKFEEDSEDEEDGEEKN